MHDSRKPRSLESPNPGEPMPAPAPDDDTHPSPHPNPPIKPAGRSSVAQQ